MKTESLADRKALAALCEAVIAWQHAMEWNWRFPNARAKAAIQARHSQIIAHYGQLSPAFLDRHPQLAEHYPRVADDLHGDAAGYFGCAVIALKERYVLD